MNMHAVTRLYAQLSPKERIPMIFSALARGDEVEVSRLGNSAPKHAFLLADHREMQKEITTFSLVAMIELLDLAAQMFLAKSKQSEFDRLDNSV